MAIREIPVAENTSNKEEVVERGKPLDTNTVPNGAAPTSNSFIGFGGVRGGLNFISGGKGSEYTSEIYKTIMEIYSKLNNKESIPDVIVLDKELDNSPLSYSVILVVKNDTKTNNVVYYTILLGSTGQKPLTAQEIFSEYDSLNRNPSAYRPKIYTIDDAINSILHNIILEKLSKTYNAKRAYPVDGVVVVDSDNSISIKDIASNLAYLAFNAIYADSLVPSPENDLNIFTAKQDTPASFFNITTNLTKSPIHNVIGEPVRSDWKVNLSLLETNKQSDVMNSISPDIELSSVTGFIEAIPQVDPNITRLYYNNVPQGPNVSINDIRLRPQIIITDIATKAPTAGYSILAIISSLVMSEKALYVKALFPTDKKNHVGYLNKITKVNNEAIPLNLTDPKFDENLVANAILSMFTLQPVLSMDIQNYGPQSFYTSVFAKAARPYSNSQEENKEKEDAGRYIVKLAHTLTNGEFPLDYHPDFIFADQGIIIPIGYYGTNNGLRDIRDIDLTMIVSKKDDDILASKWAQSSVLGNIDNFISKAEVISKIVPDAVITGKAVRVTFNNNFLAELSNAANRAGLRCRYKTDFTIGQNANINVVSNYFDTAGLNPNYGFLSNQNSYGRINYNTNFNTNGFGRWR